MAGASATSNLRRNKLKGGLEPTLEVVGTVKSRTLRGFA